MPPGVTLSPGTKGKPNYLLPTVHTSPSCSLFVPLCSPLCCLYQESPKKCGKACCGQATTVKLGGSLAKLGQPRADCGNCGALVSKSEWNDSEPIFPVTGVILKEVST